MPSEPKGNLFVPVWVDDGVVKVLVNDVGEVVVDADITGQTVDISGQTVDIAGQHIVDDSDNKSVKVMTAYGGAWRNQPMIWGFHDTLGELISIANITGADYSIYSTRVPAGEIHKIETIAFADYNSACTVVAVSVEIDGVEMNLIDQRATLAGVHYCFHFNISLGPQDRIRCRFVGGVANDDVDFNLCGYKMSYA